MRGRAVYSLGAFSPEMLAMYTRTYVHSRRFPPRVGGFKRNAKKFDA